MAYSKVTLNGTTIMDVTQDTVNASNLLSGETATRKDGVSIIGEASAGTLITKTITENGTYSAENDDADGYSEVTVNVPSGYTLEEINDLYFPAVKGDVVYNGTRIRPYIFFGNQYITSFVGNNVINASGDNYQSSQNGALSYAFCGCTNLETVSLPSLSDFYHTDYIFDNCPKLKTADLAYYDITRLPTALFRNCPALEKQVYVFPKVTSPVYAQFITNNSHITMFDLSSASITIQTGTGSNIRQNAFNGDTNFSTLIIRNTNAIRALENINAFTNTCFASGKSGGTLYVPNDLISSYQSASNWSTILGYTNNQIKSIESTHTDPTALIDLTLYYADGTPIT